MEGGEKILKGKEEEEEKNKKQRTERIERQGPKEPKWKEWRMVQRENMRQSYGKDHRGRLKSTEMQTEMTQEVKNSERMGFYFQGMIFLF